MSVATTLGAGVAGATLAYLYDPRSGRRRRARLRQWSGHAQRAAREALVRSASDLEHRAHGLVSRSGRSDTDVDDRTIVARARSRLGRVSGSVHAICVESREGVVELTGRVLEHEASSVLRVVRSTPGVRDVVDELERCTPESLPADVRRTPAVARRRKGYWHPATRLGVGVPSAAAALAGLARGGIGGLALLGVGLAGLARAATNRPISDVAGVGRSTRGFDVQKTTTIRAPVEEVYAFLTAFENFPRFMRHVERVDRVDDNRWRFVLAGPAGARIELDAVLLQAVPNELVAWSSAENAPIESTGSARFERVEPDATRVTIRMTYRPPGGVVVHELAKLFHVDPKHELDENMLRLKSLLEQGKATGHDGQVTIEELRR